MYCCSLPELKTSTRIATKSRKRVAADPHADAEDQPVVENGTMDNKQKKKAVKIQKLRA